MKKLITLIIVVTFTFNSTGQSLALCEGGGFTLRPMAARVSPVIEVFFEGDDINVLFGDNTLMTLTPEGHVKRLLHHTRSRRDLLFQLLLSDNDELVRRARLALAEETGDSVKAHSAGKVVADNSTAGERAEELTKVLTAGVNTLGKERVAYDDTGKKIYTFNHIPREDELKQLYKKHGGFFVISRITKGGLLHVKAVRGRVTKRFSLGPEYGEGVAVFRIEENAVVTSILAKKGRSMMTRDLIVIYDSKDSSTLDSFYKLSPSTAAQLYEDYGEYVARKKIIIEDGSDSAVLTLGTVNRVEFPKEFAGKVSWSRIGKNGILLAMRVGDYKPVVSVVRTIDGKPVYSRQTITLNILRKLAKRHKGAYIEKVVWREDGQIMIGGDYYTLLEYFGQKVAVYYDSKAKRTKLVLPAIPGRGKKEIDLKSIKGKYFSYLPKSRTLKGLLRGKRRQDVFVPADGLSPTSFFSLTGGQDAETIRFLFNLMPKERLSDTSTNELLLIVKRAKEALFKRLGIDSKKVSIEGIPAIICLTPKELSTYESPDLGLTYRQKHLLTRTATKGIEAQNFLLRYHQHLIIQTLDSYRQFAIDIHQRPECLTRYYSYGEQGLRNAIWSFDSSKGVPFSAWAKVQIQFAVRQGRRREQAQTDMVPVRKLGLRKPVSLDAVDEDGSPYVPDEAVDEEAASGIGADIEQTDFWDMIAKGLSKRDRTILLLSFMYGKSAAQIARRFRKSDNWAREQKRRILIHLKSDQDKMQMLADFLGLDLEALLEASTRPEANDSAKASSAGRERFAHVLLKNIRHEFPKITEERWDIIANALVTIFLPPIPANKNKFVTGSGFVFDEDSTYYYIITAAHVVRGMPPKKKLFLSLDKGYANGEVVTAQFSSDYLYIGGPSVRKNRANYVSKSDVAIIRMEKRRFKESIIPLFRFSGYSRREFPARGNQKRRKVFMVGNTSAVGRLLKVVTGEARRFPKSATLGIKDNGIVRGFSGCPVIDEYGNVIGLLHSSTSPRGETFALDITYIKQYFSRSLDIKASRIERGLEAIEEELAGIRALLQKMLVGTGVTRSKLLTLERKIRRIIARLDKLTEMANPLKQAIRRRLSDAKVRRRRSLVKAEADLCRMIENLEHLRENMEALKTATGSVVSYFGVEDGASKSPSAGETKQAKPSKKEALAELSKIPKLRIRIRYLLEYTPQEFLTELGITRNYIIQRLSINSRSFFGRKKLKDMTSAFSKALGFKLDVCHILFGKSLEQTLMETSGSSLAECLSHSKIRKRVELLCYEAGIDKLHEEAKAAGFNENIFYDIYNRRSLKMHPQTMRAIADFFIKRHHIAIESSQVLTGRKLDTAIDKACTDMAERLKLLRLVCGLSLQQLSSEAGITFKTLQHLEAKGDKAAVHKRGREALEKLRKFYTRRLKKAISISLISVGMDNDRLVREMAKLTIISQRIWFSIKAAHLSDRTFERMTGINHSQVKCFKIGTAIPTKTHIRIMQTKLCGVLGLKKRQLLLFKGETVTETGNIRLPSSGTGSKAKALSAGRTQTMGTGPKARLRQAGRSPSTWFDFAHHKSLRAGTGIAQNRSVLLTIDCAA